MKHSFIDIVRIPDSVLFQYEDSNVRFEEPDGREEQNSRIDFCIKDKAAVITLYPSERPVKRVKLRWRGDMSDCLLITGDAMERLYVSKDLRNKMGAQAFVFSSSCFDQKMLFEKMNRDRVELIKKDMQN